MLKPIVIYMDVSGWHSEGKGDHMREAAAASISGTSKVAGRTLKRGDQESVDSFKGRVDECVCAMQAIS